MSHQSTDGSRADRSAGHTLGLTRVPHPKAFHRRWPLRIQQTPRRRIYPRKSRCQRDSPECRHASIFLLTTNIVEEIGKDPNAAAFIPRAFFIRYSLAIGTRRAEKSAVFRVYDIVLKKR